MFYVQNNTTAKKFCVSFSRSGLGAKTKQLNWISDKQTKFLEIQSFVLNKIFVFLLYAIISLNLK